MHHGDLWDETDRRAQQALASGALQPIATATETVTDGGIGFVVHILEHIHRKDQATVMQRNHGRNPFLPHDPELHVADVSDTHRCLLNKFNVLRRHLLIVTRQYASQEELLNRCDLEALRRCLEAVDGLGFYNAGETAGASQAHKHLQLVPLPLGAGPEATPIGHLLRAAATGPGTVPGLSFGHAFLRFDRAEIPAASVLLEAYRDLLDRCGIAGVQQPYNLLVTRGWMLLVPRRRERYRDISVNALGFAGSLLVRDRSELELLRQVGPLQVLREVAKPPRDSWGQVPGNLESGSLSPGS